MYTIIKKISSIALVLLIHTVGFSQITTTITAGPNWKDVLLLKSLKPSESGMANTNYNIYPRLALTAWTHSGYKITY